MRAKGRYRELLLMVETCQAATLYGRVKCVERGERGKAGLVTETA
jgi:hypothetical protein